MTFMWTTDPSEAWWRSWQLRWYSKRERRLMRKLGRTTLPWR